MSPDLLGIEHQALGSSQNENNNPTFLKSLTSTDNCSTVFSHSVPTVPTVRAFPSLVIHQIKPSWTGPIRAGFKIRENHRTGATVGTEDVFKSVIGGLLSSFRSFQLRPLGGVKRECSSNQFAARGSAFGVHCGRFLGFLVLPRVPPRPLREATAFGVWGSEFGRTMFAKRYSSHFFRLSLLMGVGGILRINQIVIDRAI